MFTDLRISCLQKHDSVVYKVRKNTSNGNVVQDTIAQNKFLKYPLLIHKLSN